MRIEYPAKRGEGVREKDFLEMRRYSLIRQSVLLEMFAVGFAMVGTIPLFLRYLRSPDRSEASLSSQATMETAKKLRELEQFVLRDRTAEAGVDTVALTADLQSSITAKLADELQQRFSAETKEGIHVSLMRDMYRSDHVRLLDQISVLRKRGNLNLSIGVATTLLAAGTLLLTVSSVTGSLTDTRGLLSYYVPRISTVIFVEVFSFFFLRLYKATLAEEKYYQNEITSRTARQTALEAALNSIDATIMSKLIENLALVDHNKSHTSAIEPDVHPDLKDIGRLVESAAKVISAAAQKTHAAGSG